MKERPLLKCERWIVSIVKSVWKNVRKILRNYIFRSFLPNLTKTCEKQEMEKLSRNDCQNSANFLQIQIHANERKKAFSIQLYAKVRFSSKQNDIISVGELE